MRAHRILNYERRRINFHTKRRLRGSLRQLSPPYVYAKTHATEREITIKRSITDVALIADRRRRGDPERNSKITSFLYTFDVYTRMRAARSAGTEVTRLPHLLPFVVAHRLIAQREEYLTFTEETAVITARADRSPRQGSSL